jgi:CRP-like cAMP-binding protein
VVNRLTMKLEQFSAFDAEERARLDGLIAGPQRTYKARRDILSDGEKPEHVIVVLSGMAARYKDLPDGQRQILAFLIPGDLCDLEVFVLDQMDHGITAVVDTCCALIPADTIRQLLTEMRGLTEALWWSTMTDSAVLRERIIDHGRRDARERLAHLFYEMLVRYTMVGLADGTGVPFPLTQQELSEASGLTPVHVNRVIQQMRAEGLIELKGKVLTVLDPPRLKQVGQFSARYLHLQRTEARVGEVAARVGDLI